MFAFGGNWFGLYFYIILGAVGYALTMMLLNWHRHGWAHVRQALPRYLLALPVSLVVSTVLICCLLRARSGRLPQTGLGT